MDHWHFRDNIVDSTLAQHCTTSEYLLHVSIACQLFIHHKSVSKLVAFDVYKICHIPHLQAGDGSQASRSVTFPIFQQAIFLSSNEIVPNTYVHFPSPIMNFLEPYLTEFPAKSSHL